MPARIVGYLEKLVRFSREKGWTVHADERPAMQFVSLQKDGFGVVFQLSGARGRLGLSTTTPCVAPKQSRR